MRHAKAGSDSGFGMFSLRSGRIPLAWQSPVSIANEMFFKSKITSISLNIDFIPLSNAAKRNVTKFNGEIRYSA